MLLQKISGSGSVTLSLTWEIRCYADMNERSSSPGFPKELCCPISEDLYKDPVLLVESGQTYSRESIEKWFEKGHRTCPLTGKELNSTQLVPNYVVKGLVQSWMEGQPANGRQNSQHAEGSRSDQAKYPPVFDGGPQDKIAQAADILRHIRSPSMEVAAYRNGCSYQIWQLHSLAKDRACRDYLLREGAVGTGAMLLADENLAENSAGLLRCLATPESSQELIEAGETTCAADPAAKLIIQILAAAAFGTNVEWMKNYNLHFRKHCGWHRGGGQVGEASQCS